MEDMEMSSDSENSQNGLNKQSYFSSQNNANSIKGGSNDCFNNDLDNEDVSRVSFLKKLDTKNQSIDLDHNDVSLKSKNMKSRKKNYQISSSELSDFNISQLNEFSDLALVKRLIKNTRRRFVFFG